MVVSSVYASLKKTNLLPPWWIDLPILSSAHTVTKRAVLATGKHTDDYPNSHFYDIAVKWLNLVFCSYVKLYWYACHQGHKTLYSYSNCCEDYSNTSLMSLCSRLSSIREGLHLITIPFPDGEIEERWCVVFTKWTQWPSCGPYIKHKLYARLIIIHYNTDNVSQIFSSGPKLVVIYFVR